MTRSYVFPLFCVFMLLNLHKKSLSKKKIISIDDLTLNDFGIMVVRKYSRNTIIPATIEPNYINKDNTLKPEGLKLLNGKPWDEFENPCGRPNNPCIFAKLELKYLSERFSKKDINRRYSSIMKKKNFYYKR